MQSDLTLDEVLKSVFSILADEKAMKPKRRGEPVADPALWRALQNQDRSLSTSYANYRSHIPFAPSPSGRK